MAEMATRRVSFPAPPRFTGDSAVDYASLIEYEWDLYKAAILSGGFVQPDNLGALAVLNTVNTDQIDDSAVTFAKMQNVTNVRLLGRSATADGLPMEITIGTDLSLAGGVLSSTAVAFTDEKAQDAVGAMIDGTLVYVDGTPLLTRAALTGAVTAAQGSNTTALGSFTKAQLDAAVSDGNVLFVGDVTQYTDEMAQDAVGGILTNTSSITFTYNDGAGTITANLVVATASGRYTPTLTNVTNLDASTPYSCHYTRTGDEVTVSGVVDVDPTAGTVATKLRISLPIASNLGVVADLAGCAFCDSLAGEGAALYADAANNEAAMAWITGSTANRSMFFNFMYQVI